MMVSDAVIRRLPTYYRYLTMLHNDGVLHISSFDLGKTMGLTPSQVRQDINCFGGAGRQGFGYSVISLKDHIAKIMGIKNKQNMVIIGSGNIGSAISGYVGFSESGFNVSALFDSDEKKLDKTINGVPVLPISELPDFLMSNDISIAVIACPESVAQKMANTVMEYGIKGIWNFAPIDIRTPESVVCVNVSLLETLQQLSFRLNNLKK